jgi:hypothetical protein
MVKVNITVQVQDLSTKKPIDNLTQHRFSAPSLSNFQRKAIGLYSMDIQLASAGPKKGTAQMQVCAPGFLCKTQEVEAPDPPGSIFTFQLPESPPLKTTFFARDGADVRLNDGDYTTSDSITFFAFTEGGQDPYRYIYTFDEQPTDIISESHVDYILIKQGKHRMVVTTIDANNIKINSDPFYWTVVAP